MSFPGLSPHLERLFLSHVAGSTREGVSFLPRFKQRLDSEEMHPVDLETLHLARVVHDHFAAVDLAVHEVHEVLKILHGHSYLSVESLKVPALLRRPHPMIRDDGQGEVPRGVLQWRAREGLFWTRLSNEADMAFHFWRPQPRGVIVAVGPFQGYNLVGPGTDYLIRVDYDARQVALDAVIGCLSFISGDGHEVIDRFLTLNDPRRAQEIVRAVAEKTGRGEGRPPVNYPLMWDLSLRTGALSLLGLHDAYRAVFEGMKKGLSLDEDQTMNFEWLRNPMQFRLVRDLFIEGRIVSFQTDLSDPNTLIPVRDFLSERGCAVSQFYLSNVIDVAVDRTRGGWMTLQAADSSESYGTFFEFMRTILHFPLSDEAVIQWTNVLSRRHSYWEAPMGLVRSLLTEAENCWADRFSLRERLTDRAIRIDGKCWISSYPWLDPSWKRPPNMDLDAIVFADLVEREGSDLKRAIEERFLGKGLPEFQKWLQTVDAFSSPEGRGRLRALLFEIEEENAFRVFPEGEFDPLPREVRVFRRKHWPANSQARLEELRWRRDQW